MIIIVGKHTLGKEIQIDYIPSFISTKLDCIQEIVIGKRFTHLIFVSSILGEQCRPIFSVLSVISP